MLSLLETDLLVWTFFRIYFTNKLSKFYVTAYYLSYIKRNHGYELYEDV